MNEQDQVHAVIVEYRKQRLHEQNIQLMVVFALASAIIAVGLAIAAMPQ